MFEENVPLALYTTLKAGGAARRLAIARNREDLALVSQVAAENGWPHQILGWGSNVLPSDRGVEGLVTINRARRIDIKAGGIVEADCGAGFQDLFLRTAQSGLGGFEFAVGIPGSVGGALVSNAGAYRNEVSTHLQAIEVWWEGERRWLDASFMEFSYRDSVLRRENPPAITLLGVRFQLNPRAPKQIYDDAREYQRQRISKQPPPASAGSFFKNVVDAELAKRIPGLTEGMVASGVVPAGFLIQECGLKGKRFGGAMIGSRHANFILNVGGASASEIRRLAEYAASQVRKQFGANLEEEALYIGDWDGWEATGLLAH